MQAFKFPQNNHVHLTCNIELCKGTCPERCPLESSTIDGGSGGESSKPSQEESSVDVSNGKDDDDDEDSDNGMHSVVVAGNLSLIFNVYDLMFI